MTNPAPRAHPIAELVPYMTPEQYGALAEAHVHHQLFQRRSTPSSVATERTG